MPEFLSFLLTALLVLYIVRSLARILLPMLFQSVINNAKQQHPPASSQQNYRTNSNTSQGKVRVDYVPDSKKGSVPDSEGEFVDYEEIK